MNHKSFHCERDLSLSLCLYAYVRGPQMIRTCAYRMSDIPVNQCLPVHALITGPTGVAKQMLTTIISTMVDCS